ncbi:MAG: polysaccharide deacetylase family protein [Solobacterium sp.]|nr:polysaccharide deacetylase family protein [Solobacterium sp.]
MEEKNRRIIGNTAALTVIAAGFLAGGMYLSRLNTEKKDTEERIRTLEAEATEMRVKTEAAEDLILSHEEALAALDGAEDRPAAEKERYYSLCKELEDAVLDGKADCKIAYLTFDDGPYVNTTPLFLDVLDEYDVLATFFMLGKPGEENDAIYHRIYDTGHTIGNHTYAHAMQTWLYESAENFLGDVKKNREFIQEKLGITTNLVRFPGGSSSSRGHLAEIAEGLREMGYGYVDWNSATWDSIALLSPEEYRDHVLEETWDRKVLVVLMHDYSHNTLAALPEIITGLREQGYVLLPLFYDSAMVSK